MGRRRSSILSKRRSKAGHPGPKGGYSRGRLPLSTKELAKLLANPGWVWHVNPCKQCRRVYCNCKQKGGETDGTKSR